jgi:cellobiose-specific phosphotransferase system component IIC
MKQTDSSIIIVRNVCVLTSASMIVYLFFTRSWSANWTLRMSDNLPERVQILCHAHIICITVLENRIICCQIFCDLLLKSAFEWIFNVMQLILVKIKWHIKWKYLIQKFWLTKIFKESSSKACLKIFSFQGYFT